MPELPEVTTMVNGLKKRVLNRAIIDVWTDAEKLIKNLEFEKFKKQIKGKKIIDIFRKGKVICFQLDNDKILFVHPKMSGHFLAGKWDRVEIAGLVGGKAKGAGKRNRGIREIEYQCQKIETGSPEHHELMRRAIRAKLEQNPGVLKLLMDTGDKQITHVLKTSDGEILSDSKTIPGAVFSQSLMDLREEFRQQMEEKKD